ncbi:LOW QUALITY PROTEIN: LETM1 domain-containing protein 1 [Lagopus leucura]|uniref:LOW QUALITY PROTEIN: LETM1 domain-containing protein 1 n=1 Tax=Lagopus leucura TaxID=30410 RepID=UPI001C674E0A|nr:LOW QUALITY PROTEIN: LETM1 domain-containing protein 1 [Lagopus leucura]
MEAAMPPIATSALIPQPFPLPVTCPPPPPPAKMALCRMGRCGAERLWGPVPPLLAALRPPPVLSLPTKASSRWALGARWLRSRYERFLQHRFPRLYALHSAFTAGLESLLADAREVRRIRQAMARHGLSAAQLNYRDMERLRQFRRDVLKAVPVALIAIPPFANFLVLLLMYFFPRQLLIRHFWTPRQQQEFSEENHSARRAAYPAVLSCLDAAAQSLPQQQLQRRLRELCVEVQRGRHPLVAELCALQPLFSGPALRLAELRGAHVRALSRVLFLTPLLPAILVRRRLHSHLLEIRHLDRALARLGLAQLSEEELRAACYLRGLNPARLSAAQCRAWLEQWLRLSCVLQASEASLLANSMVLLSLNYAGAKQ